MVEFGVRQGFAHGLQIRRCCRDVLRKGFYIAFIDLLSSSKFLENGQLDLLSGQCRLDVIEGIQGVCRLLKVLIVEVS